MEALQFLPHSLLYRLIPIPPVPRTRRPLNLVAALVRAVLPCSHCQPDGHPVRPEAVSLACLRSHRRAPHASRSRTFFKKPAGGATTAPKEPTSAPSAPVRHTCSRAVLSPLTSVKHVEVVSDDDVIIIDAPPAPKAAAGALGQLFHTPPHLFCHTDALRPNSARQPGGCSASLGEQAASRGDASACEEVRADLSRSGLLESQRINA